MTGRSVLSTALFLLLAPPITPALHARDNPADLCLQAAAEAASTSGVPYDVLRAIATVETGREGQPWPWTANFGGDGRWYDSAEEVERTVSEALSAGTTNVDLGCFQLNYRWHGEEFASLADMLDPTQNAAYAAGFLADHYARTGDWALAAAAYHSATPEFASAYQAKFETVYAGLAGGDAPPRSILPEAEERTNRFPLLIAGATGSHGSLVPAGGTGIRLIGAP